MSEISSHLNDLNYRSKVLNGKILLNKIKMDTKINSYQLLPGDRWRRWRVLFMTPAPPANNPRILLHLIYPACFIGLEI